ncbi:MAG: tetratricopeptide repeat protein [Rhodobacterales bacterium]|nr:tetratricopeptide repeat protein [Rhodobacterales bacterium]
MRTPAGRAVEALRARAADLRAANDPAGAIRLYRQALSLIPRHVPILNDLGATLMRMGDLSAAEAPLRAARAADPGHRPSAANLATLLRLRGRHQEHLALLTEILDRHPADGQAALDRGDARRRAGDLAGAVADYRRASETAPHLAAAWINLGGALLQSGDAGGAIAAYESLLAREPDHGRALAGAWQARREICAFDGIDAVEAGLDRANAAALAAGRVPPETPMMRLKRIDDPAALKALTRAWAPAPPAAGPAPPSPRTPDTKGPLRIGLMASGLRANVCGFHVATLLDHLDADRLQVFLYSLLPMPDAPVGARLRARARAVRDLTGLPAAVAAQTIRGDRLDLLIDVAGHTLGGRPDILARRPAPVQATYLGYPGTSGSPALDLAITDVVADPAEFTEALARLPSPFMPWNPVAPPAADDDAARARGRRDLGLADDAVVLACPAWINKITPSLLDLWLGVLADHPHAVLMVAGDSPALRRHLGGRAAARGVPAERLLFMPVVGHQAFLERLALADVGLDSFPYTTHTTMMEALWAGLPMVSLRGRQYAAAIGAAFVDLAGLPDLVADSPEGYRRRVDRLVTDPAFRAACRAHLIAGRATCRLFDTAATARAVTRAIETIVARSRRGEPQGPFDVAD